MKKLFLLLLILNTSAYAARSLQEAQSKFFAALDAYTQNPNYSTAQRVIQEYDTDENTDKYRRQFDARLQRAGVSLDTLRAMKPASGGGSQTITALVPQEIKKASNTLEVASTDLAKFAYYLPDSVKTFDVWLKVVTPEKIAAESSSASLQEALYYLQRLKNEAPDLLREIKDRKLETQFKNEKERLEKNLPEIENRIALIQQRLAMLGKSTTPTPELIQQEIQDEKQVAELLLQEATPEKLAAQSPEELLITEGILVKHQQKAGDLLAQAAPQSQSAQDIKKIVSDIDKTIAQAKAAQATKKSSPATPSAFEKGYPTAKTGQTPKGLQPQFQGIDISDLLQSLTPQLQDLAAALAAAGATYKAPLSDDLLKDEAVKAFIDDLAPYIADASQRFVVAQAIGKEKITELFNKASTNFKTARTFAATLFQDAQAKLNPKFQAAGKAIDTNIAAGGEKIKAALQQLKSNIIVALGDSPTVQKILNKISPDLAQQLMDRAAQENNALIIKIENADKEALKGAAPEAVIQENTETFIVEKDGLAIVVSGPENEVHAFAKAATLADIQAFAQAEAASETPEQEQEDEAFGQDLEESEKSADVSEEDKQIAAFMKEIQDLENQQSDQANTISDENEKLLESNITRNTILSGAATLGVTAAAAKLVELNKQDLESVTKINAAENKVNEMALTKADKELQLKQAEERRAQKIQQRFIDAKNKQLMHDRGLAETKIKTYGNQMKLSQDKVNQLIKANSSLMESVSKANALEKLQSELKSLTAENAGYAQRLEEFKKGARSPVKDALIKSFNPLYQRNMRKIKQLEKQIKLFGDVAETVKQAQQALETIKQNKQELEQLAQEVKVFAQEISNQQTLKQAAEKGLFSTTSNDVMQTVKKINTQFKMPQLPVEKPAPITAEFQAALEQGAKFKKPIRIPASLKTAGNVSPTVTRGLNAMMRVIKVMPK